MTIRITGESVKLKLGTLLVIGLALIGWAIAPNAFGQTVQCNPAHSHDNGLTQCYCLNSAEGVCELPTECVEPMSDRVAVRRWMPFDEIVFCQTHRCVVASWQNGIPTIRSM